MSRRGLKATSADRPDVAASKTREEVDVGGPRADTGIADEPAPSLLRQMLRERIDGSRPSLTARRAPERCAPWRPKDQASSESYRAFAKIAGGSKGMQKLR